MIETLLSHHTLMMSLLALITARQVSIYEKYFVKICLLDLVVFIFLADNCQEVVQVTICPCAVGLLSLSEV